MKAPKCRRGPCNNKAQKYGGIGYSVQCQPCNEAGGVKRRAAAKRRRETGAELKSKPKGIPFVNADGRVIHLDENLTIPDLVRMGITISFVVKGRQLAKGEYASVP